MSPSRRAALVVAAVLTAVPAAGCGPDGAPSADTGDAAGVDARVAVDTLVLGGTVVTMDSERRVLDPGALAIDDGALVAVGPRGDIVDRYRSADVVQLGPRDMVVPGLVNGHGHAPMSLLRGVADDLRLMEWLEGYIFPAEGALVDEEFVRVGAELAALEMIATGTTTFVDMYYFEDQVARVVVETGLRGVVGETILDLPAPDHDTVDAALETTRAFLEKWTGDPRVTPAVAPHSAYLASPETLRRCAELAREYGVPLLIHLAETRDEEAQVLESHGRRPVPHLESLGFLGPDVVAAHGVWLDAGDREILARLGVGVVHNPESNMKLVSGAMPVEAVRTAGVAVGLGTDGPASNNDLDMFGAMHAAALLAKHASGDPTALPAPEVLAMATIEGATALGMADRIGSLEAGKRADLIVVDGDAINLVPRYDPYSHLVYATRGDDVELTMVDGRILFRGGAFTSLDPEGVRRRARQLAERVRATVSAGPQEP